MTEAVPMVAYSDVQAIGKTQFGGLYHGFRSPLYQSPLASRMDTIADVHPTALGIMTPPAQVLQKRKLVNRFNEQVIISEQV